MKKKEEKSSSSSSSSSREEEEEEEEEEEKEEEGEGGRGGGGEEEEEEEENLWFSNFVYVIVTVYLAYFESFIVYKMLISHVMCPKRLMNVTFKRSQLFYLGLWACQSYISLHREPTDSNYWVCRTTQKWIMCLKTLNT